jgi:D-alanyl-D-alanine carboxypeptidase
MTTTSPSDELQQLVEAEIGNDTASCILRVEAPEIGLTWAGSAGTVSLTDRRPVNPTDSFRIASVTKSFTAVVVMQLVDERTVDLDEPVAPLLDPAAVDVIDRIHTYDGHAYGRDLTLRQLLRHSSGIFDYASAPGFFDAIADDPARRWSPHDLVEGAVRWGSPLFAPDAGYKYAYTDTGYVFLGLMIEHVTGKPLHEVYRTRIHEPLRLTNTYLEGYEPHRGRRLTHAYEGEFDVMVIDGSADWAGGGLVSTAGDLASFAQALVGGELVTEPLLSDMFDYEFRTLDPSQHGPGYIGYALGIDARVSGSRLLRGHRGHWGVLMHIDPTTGLTITGTINQSSRRPDSVMNGVVDIVTRHR